MANLKNYTPLSIALVGSFVLGIVCFVCFLFIGQTLVTSLLFSFILLLVSLVIIFVVLHFYLYQRLNIIYSSIHKIKNNNKEKDSILTSNPLKQMEEDVKEWEVIHKQEEKEQLKKESFRKEFLGNVAHELKTPITNIQGYIHTLLDGALYDKEVNEKFLLKASNNADRMQYLVEELLTINRFEHGNLKLDISNFDIIELCNEVIDSLEEKASKHETKIIFNESNTKKVFVKADKNLIHQVLTNLIVNGIKYNNPKGFVKISFEQFAETTILTIEDNGLGIEEEYLPRIFERFYRVDQSRARTLGGTGLGLAIVKHILNAHEQNITVKSIVNEGSSFSFSLESVR